MLMSAKGCFFNFSIIKTPTTLPFISRVLLTYARDRHAGAPQTVFPDR